jgi:tetratricopeptide (TPR) repeat protein
MLFAISVVAAVAGEPEAAGDGRSTAAARLPAADYYALVQEADAAFRAFDYARAAPLYERITQENPYSGDLWLRLARCQERCEQFERAISSFERAVALGDDSSPGQTEYLIALLYVRTGDAKSAIDWLEKALAARHEHRPVLRTDKRLDTLRSDPRFARLAAAAVDADTLSREERWRRDLDHLIDEAGRMHVQWHEGDRAERFCHAVRGIQERIGDLTDEQILVEMQQAVVLLGDGHSAVRTRGKVPAPQRLPLTLYFFSDGLFIIDAAERYRDLVGCRIDKIGRAPTAEAERLVAQVVSRDNPMGIKANAPFSLVNTQRLLSLGIIDDPNAVRMQVTDRADKSSTVVIEPGEPFARTGDLFASKLPGSGDPPLYLTRVGDNLWFEPLPEIDGLYVQFNDVVDRKGRQLVDIARELRDYLAAHSPKVLVLDVRHNGGGNSYLYPPLLKAILFYELTQPDGKIFAIIGRQTFSAAQNFTNDIDRLTSAIFVGEPTGSRPSFAGESTEGVLPYSGVGFGISTRLHQHAYATDRRIWIAPDVLAELSSADYFANGDPALEAVFGIAKRQQATAAE